MKRPISGVALAVVVICGAAGQVQAQQILQHDPPPGLLAKGMTVLVDDGSCPAGQIKQVKAGDNKTSSGNAKSGGAR